MGKTYFLLLALFITSIVNAQDTIVLLDGSELKVKVEKISDTELEFRMWNNQDGPIRVKKISDVFMVKYRNGQHEVFRGAKLQENHNLGSLRTTSGLTLMRDGGYIVSVEKGKLSDKELESILGEELWDNYSTAYSSYSGGVALVTIGWLSLFAGAGAMFSAYFNGNQSVYIVGYALCILTDILHPIGYILRGVNAGKISRIAETYNMANHKSLSMDFNITPTIMTTSSGIAPGIGLSIAF